MKPTTRARLARYHRWTALTLLPVYVTLLLSGAVLALHPMLHPRQKEPAASPLDTARFGALLRQVDASGKVDGVGVDPDGHTLTLFDRGAARTHDLISRAFDIARDSVDMARLRFINRMPNGAAFLVTEGRFGIARYVVTARSVDPLGGPAVELARRVHAGEWGGVWGGALDLAGALGLLAVLGSGTLSWWRRRRRALPNGVAAGDGRGGESLEAA